jgi:hypothetical protein
MAALTQDEWYEKIKAWVPTWFFSNPSYQVALFQAIAKLLASADTEMRAQFDETFITRAMELMLDQHGYERGIIRYVDETDGNYSERIRNLANVLTPDSVLILANAFIINGRANVVEHNIEGIFCDRDSFISRQEVFSDIFYNTFSVVIPYQGNNQAAERALIAIATTINNSKALGTLYRLVETLE